MKKIRVKIISKNQWFTKDQNRRIYFTEKNGLISFATSKIRSILRKNPKTNIRLIVDYDSLHQKNEKCCLRAFHSIRDITWFNDLTSNNEKELIRGLKIFLREY